VGSAAALVRAVASTAAASSSRTATAMQRLLHVSASCARARERDACQVDGGSGPAHRTSHPDTSHPVISHTATSHTASSQRVGIDVDV
jgi:hypothetical protein